MKNEIRIEVLENAMLIPSGLNIPFDMKITDVRATRYEYYGNKYAESNEHYENKALSLKIEHSQIVNPFWITIFEGATCRKKSTRCIIATFEETINENFNLTMEMNTVYKYDCVTQGEDTNIEGIDIIKEVVFAFNCKIYDGDESGLYAEKATTDNNCDAINDAIEELINMNFIEINKRFSKINPDAVDIKELATTLNDICSGKLYAVTVVNDSCIQEVDKFLNKEEAESIFIKYCLKYYSEEGVERYLEKLGLKSFEELSIENWESYFHSEAWYDINDLANVEINLM